MGRVCEYCGKHTRSGAMIARRGLPKKKGGVGLRITGHTFRKFKANVQRVRAVVDGRVQRVKICTQCMRRGKLAKPGATPAA